MYMQAISSAAGTNLESEGDIQNKGMALVLHIKEENSLELVGCYNIRHWEKAGQKPESKTRVGRNGMLEWNV